MPEGDTLHKLARYLSPKLRGRVLEPFEPQRSPRALVVSDDRVCEVMARGKHLLIQLDSGRSLRVHLGMHGTFHHYHRDARWKRSPRTAQLILVSGDDLFVCFRPTKVELSHATPPTAVRALGPDLALGLPESEELWERIQRAIEHSPRLDDLLLDQRVSAGIGNVYKSEILFIHKLSPHRLVKTLEPKALFPLFESGSILLRDNLNGGPRITTRKSLPELDAKGSNLWVYGRRAQPCFRCHAPIQKVMSGRQARITYWCAQCQV